MPTNGAIVSLLSFPTKGPQRCSARRERKRGEEKRSSKRYGNLLNSIRTRRYSICHSFPGATENCHCCSLPCVYSFQGERQRKSPDSYIYTHTHTADVHLQRYKDKKKTQGDTDYDDDDDDGDDKRHGSPKARAMQSQWKSPALTKGRVGGGN